MNSILPTATERHPHTHTDTHRHTRTHAHTHLLANGSGQPKQHNLVSCAARCRRKREILCNPRGMAVSENTEGSQHTWKPAMELLGTDQLKVLPGSMLVVAYRNSANTTASRLQGTDAV